MEGLGLGFVANHFDVVPVRTNDESCIERWPRLLGQEFAVYK
jgi:hypothetical protein